MLGYHPDIAQHRHEVVVAFPAGNDVKVQMRLDARARRLSEVVSDIKSVGFQVLAENDDTSLAYPEQLGALFFGQAQWLLLEEILINFHPLPAGNLFPGHYHSTQNQEAVLFRKQKNHTK